MKSKVKSEAEIFAQVVVPNGVAMTRDAAALILHWRFTEQDHDLMRELLDKNREDEISAEQRELLDRYGRVGMCIDILQARARLVLMGKPDI